MDKFKDLSGMKFGKLNVVKLSNRNNHGKIVYECNCDYDKIKNYCWRSDNDNYIISYDTKLNNYSTIWMHRIILNLNDKNLEVDHKNHNKNDNRKINLRVLTHAQNGKNQSLSKNNKSGTSDVCWHKSTQKGQARICVNNKRIYLGCFSDINEAIKVRKEAEEKYFGEYSYNNSMKK